MTISPDFKRARARLELRWYNRNYFGAHFGGSLFSMTDPFYVKMLHHHLGQTHVVWDQAAQITYHRPGKGSVEAEFVVTDEILDEIRARTASGEKYNPVFRTEIRDERGELVAEVVRTLYVRLKRGQRPDESKGAEAERSGDRRVTEIR